MVRGLIGPCKCATCSPASAQFYQILSPDVGAPIELMWGGGTENKRAPFNKVEVPRRFFGPSTFLCTELERGRGTRIPLSRVCRAHLGRGCDIDQCRMVHVCKFILASTFSSSDVIAGELLEKSTADNFEAFRLRLHGIFEGIRNECERLAHIGRPPLGPRALAPVQPQFRQCNGATNGAAGMGIFGRGAAPSGPARGRDRGGDQPPRVSPPGAARSAEITRPGFGGGILVPVPQLQPQPQPEPQPTPQPEPEPEPSREIEDDLSGGYLSDACSSLSDSDLGTFGSTPTSSRSSSPGLDPATTVSPTATPPRPIDSILIPVPQPSAPATPAKESITQIFRAPNRGQRSLPPLVPLMSVPPTSQPVSQPTSPPVGPISPQWRRYVRPPLSGDSDSTLASEKMSSVPTADDIAKFLNYTSMLANGTTNTSAHCPPVPVKLDDLDGLDFP